MVTALGDRHKRTCTVDLARAIATIQMQLFNPYAAADMPGFTAGCLLPLSETDGRTAYGLMRRVPKGYSSDGIFVGCVAILVL